MAKLPDVETKQDSLFMAVDWRRELKISFVTYIGEIKFIFN